MLNLVWAYTLRVFSRISRFLHPSLYDETNPTASMKSPSLTSMRTRRDRHPLSIRLVETSTSRPAASAFLPSTHHAIQRASPNS